jgi:hypothetical protein
MGDNVLIYIGLFVAGVSASAFAAVYTPRRRNWGYSDAPRVRTRIQVRGNRYDQ